MITKTFIHLPGIGLKSEARLWANGIRSWDEFRAGSGRLFPPSRAAMLLEEMAEYAGHLHGRPEMIAAGLPASQHWRFFPHFRESTAYLDIETTGLADNCEITTIALYDGKEVRHYVQGENLDDFPTDIDDYSVIVTYNGKTFDVPVINRYFDIELNQAHIDLRYVLHNLGIKGGLKGCERQLGLDRGELDGVDGFMAVMLWDHYLGSGERRALDTLLAYNIMDTVNLERLMVEAYNRNLALTPFRDEVLPEPPAPPQPDFQPDRQLIDALQQRLRATGSYWS